MEIREQDFSFNDDTREQPLVEVVTNDVRTADIFNIMEAVRGEEEEEVLGDETASWWTDAVTEEFTRQDVVLLALIGVCACRLLCFVGHITWKLMRLMIMQWYDVFGKEGHEEDEGENIVVNSESLRKQLAIIRFCRLQFLLVIEKLQHEMRDSKNQDTQKMLASLVVLQCKDEKKVTLAEILATLQAIQAQDACFFKSREAEEHFAEIKQDVEDEEALDAGLAQAWEQLQQTYVSFLRIQATLLHQQTHRKTQRWQVQQQKETGRCRRRHFSCKKDSTNEVLHELEKLTKELPQGFTADMFTSLGKAIHEKVILSSADIKTRST